MPRVVTTTKTLTDARLRALTIDFSNVAPGSPPLVTVNYQVIDEDGEVFENKRVGGKAVPAAIRTAVRTWWDQLKTDILADEGLS